MTQTTIAKQIPAEGLTFQAGDVELRIFQTPQAGILIQGRRGGAIDPALCSRFNFEWDALKVWNALTAEHTPAVAPVTTAPTLAPAAKGSATKVSDPAHTALAVAELNGSIERGGKLGQADIRLINSLAKRGYVKRTEVMQGLRKVVTGAAITPAGQRRLAELTAADRETADRAARIAAALAIGTTPTAQLISA